MYSLLELLKNIGLSKKEATAYLIALKIGTNPASIIAKHAELNRCTTYAVLESLVAKGLAYVFEKSQIKYFTAVEPNQLINYVEEKNKDLKYYKEELTALLPEFENIKHSSQIVPSIKSYSGKSGIKKIFYDALKEDSLSVSAYASKQNNEFLNKFAKIYLETKNPFRLMRFNKNGTQQRVRIASKEDLKRIRPCIPTEIISDKKAFIISPSQPYGIIIENPDLVQFFKNQFLTIWNK